MYTGFVAPADDVVDDAVARALGAAGERVPRGGWRRVEHGSANLVVLAGRVAVRVARSADAASEALRAQRLVDALPTLPFAVPRSAGPAIDDRAAGGVVAIAQERVDGEPHPSAAATPSSFDASSTAFARPTSPRCEGTWPIDTPSSAVRRGCAS